MSNNGRRKCKYFGSMISFSSFFFFLRNLLIISQNPLLYSSSSEQMPSHHALCYCLIFWNFLSSDQTTYWKTDSVVRQVSSEVSQLSWPTDAAKQQQRDKTAAFLRLSALMHAQVHICAHTCTLDLVCNLSLSKHTHTHTKQEERYGANNMLFRHCGCVGFD